MQFTIMQPISASLTRGDPKGIKIPLLRPPFTHFAAQDDQFMYWQYMSLLFSSLLIQNIKIQVNED